MTALLEGLQNSVNVASGDAAHRLRYLVVRGRHAVMVMDEFLDDLEDLALAESETDCDREIDLTSNLGGERRIIADDIASTF